MDLLDDLVARCQALTPGPTLPTQVRDLVWTVDLAALGTGILARPKPWFFHASNELTVFATRGLPGTGSAPHDHGLWAVIACLEGREGSRWYETRGDELVEIGTECIHAGDVHVVPETAIHAVFNCWTEPNLVLHLYGGDFVGAPKRVWDPITGFASPLGLTEPLAPLDGAR